MLLDQESLRLIFGLKLRTLRRDKGLSLKSLARNSQLSPSYINEIEKGKKYPKNDKIMVLAEALGVSYDELISLKLKKELSHLSEILEKNLLRGLPFDVFGIQANVLFEIIAEAPQQFSGLIGTLLELTRNHGIRVESFFCATLRSYLDMNNNYFPALEQKAEDFRHKYPEFCQMQNLRAPEKLSKLVREKFKAEVTETDFAKLAKPLRQLSFFIKTTKRKNALVFNKKMSRRKKIALLVQEAAYHHLKVGERMISPLLEHLDSYEQLFNDFQTNYFADAVLMPQARFLMEAKRFFLNKNWDTKKFQQWMDSYPGTYTQFFQRLTQILPTFLDMDQIFLLKLRYEEEPKQYTIVRELHLSSLHSPHQVEGGEHYCRRWISTSLIAELRKNKKTEVAGAQISSFHGTLNQYLCVSVAYEQKMNTGVYGCLTLGIALNDQVRRKIAFSDDTKVMRKTVSGTCEQCAITDCKERVAPNTSYNRRQAQDTILTEIGKLSRD